MEEQAGITSFEPDQEQNNLFLLELIRIECWMFGLDVFKELWGLHNFECILLYTMAEALMQKNNKFFITKQELDTFFGLCLLSGVFKGRNEPLISCWELEHGRPIFRETMSRKKFQSILSYIRFEDKNSRPIRRSTDKFAAI